MNEPVFGDSSGFISAFDRNDANHGTSAEVWHELATHGVRIITTNMVMAETVTYLRRRAGWAISNKLGELFLSSSVIELVLITREQLAAGWHDFVKNADPKLSLCDALSFIVMRERSLRRVLTYDKHFAHAGFEILDVHD